MLAESSGFGSQGLTVKGSSSMFLTPDELAAMDTTVTLVHQLRAIVGDGPTRTADMNEFIVLIHGIQRGIMSQAAARAYPDRFRLLGGTVEG